MRPDPHSTINHSEERPAGESRLSRASAQRFSLYLRHLEDLVRRKQLKVSSSELGEALSVTDAQVRKDLATLGSLGQPGIGYATHDLIAAIRSCLGIDRPWSAALVGVGNLGRALLGYHGFRQRGFEIVSLFDVDPDKIGDTIDGLTIHSLEEAPTLVQQMGIGIGLVAVPSDSAQWVADQLVAGGVRGLLNFAPIVLRIPDHVRVLSVDLTVQLEQLAFLIEGNAREQG